MKSWCDREGERASHLVRATNGTSCAWVSKVPRGGGGFGSFLFGYKVCVSTETEGLERTVDEHLAVRNDGLDLSLLLQVLQALASQRAVDLQSVNQGGDGDETVGLDVLVQLLGGGLVENDGVLGLVLDCRQAKGQRMFSIMLRFCPKVGVK